MTYVKIFHSSKGCHQYKQNINNIHVKLTVVRGPQETRNVNTGTRRRSKNFLKSYIIQLEMKPQISSYLHTCMKTKFKQKPTCKVK